MSHDAQRHKAPQFAVNGKEKLEMDHDVLDRVPPHTRNGLQAMWEAKGRSIALEHRAEVLQRMALGEPITSIAQSLGYSDHSGIIHRIGDDKDYQAALKAGLVGKIEKREGELEAADSNVTVTRADRLLAHARWMAERLDGERFGNKQQVTINIGDLGDRLRRARERVIEHDAPQQVQCNTKSKGEVGEELA